MFKNLLLSIITVAVVIVSGAFVFQVVSTNNRAKSGEAAISACSSKMYPRGESAYIYAQFDQCVASKGFSGLEK